MGKPKITLFVDIVSPFAYIGYYALRVRYLSHVRWLHHSTSFSSKFGVFVMQSSILVSHSSRIASLDSISMPLACLSCMSFVTSVNLLSHCHRTLSQLFVALIDLALTIDP